MRFGPAAAALSLFLAVNASVGHADNHVADPRAASLVVEGRAALAAGNAQGAIDAFEAALVIDPAHTAIFLELAAAARVDGLQGKAIRYYREALERDPGNYAAISGEGEALVEKGALEKAKRNLAVLKSQCGSECPETLALQKRVDRGVPVQLPEQMAADTASKEDGVAQN
ncbi:MAG: tetratricopeptide repeat protein [Marinomonas sp.]